MISWIQKYFQQHFRSIFAILLAVTIISFIFTIGAAPGIGNGDRHSVERRVFGYNLGSQDDQSRLFGDASLSAQLQAGYAPEGAELENYAFHRAASLQLADKLHLPQPTKQEIADFIKTLRIFSGQDGEFDPQRYAMFRDSLKTNPRMNETSVSRVLADDVRANQLERLIAGPGYVLASDVKLQLEQADASWTLGVAKVDYASFKPSIPVTDAILTKFFEENSFRYEIPPRIDVNYVEYSVLSLMPTITVTEPEVRAYYDANPARFPKPAKPADAKAPAKSDPAADYAAVRPQVETTLKFERARQAAAKAAADLSFALFDRKIAIGTPAFDNFIASQHLTVKSMKPFTHEDGPAEFGGSKEIAEEAFKLGPDRTFSDAVTAPTGALVLFWKDLEPARKPAFAEVRAKVQADYLDGEKRKRFVELSRTVKSTIEARLKAGDSFDKAVAASAAADNVKIEAKMLPPFTRRQPPQDVDYSVFGALERLEKGHVSDMIIAKDEGLVVYAADKKMPNLTESNPQFTAAHQQMAATTARLTANAYLSNLVAAELKKSEPPTQ